MVKLACKQTGLTPYVGHWRGVNMVVERQNAKRYRVVLADDNEAMRDALATHLGPEYLLVGSVTDGRALVETALELHPDVGIVDISMPIMNGIAAASEIKRRGSKMKMIFLTVNEDPDFVRAAFAAGASAYVVKRRMATDIPKALIAVLSGHEFISPHPALTEDISD